MFVQVVYLPETPVRSALGEHLQRAVTPSLAGPASLDTPAPWGPPPRTNATQPTPVLLVPFWRRMQTHQPQLLTVSVRQATAAAQAAQGVSCARLALMLWEVAWRRVCLVPLEQPVLRALPGRSTARLRPSHALLARWVGWPCKQGGLFVKMGVPLAGWLACSLPAEHG